MIDRTELESQKLIAQFMTASAPLEAYLQQHDRLTALEVQSLTITLTNLQTFLDIWRQNEGRTSNSFIQLPSRLDETP